MSDRDFAPIATALRDAVGEFYRERGESLDGPAGQNTLETNSGYVERRGRPLLDILRRRAGVESLEGLRLVDLGCGFGALALYFARHGAKVTAVDPNGDRFAVGRAVAESHSLTVRFRRGRMQALKLPDARYDIAIQNNSFCYIVAPAERHEALVETLRVLRPGGWLVARNPNGWNPVDQFTGVPLLGLLPPAWAVTAARSLGRRRSAVRLSSPIGARRELQRAGFVDVEHAGAPTRPGSPAIKLLARYHHFSARRPSMV